MPLANIETNIIIAYTNAGHAPYEPPQTDRGYTTAIYINRERERERKICVYIYIYIFKGLTPVRLPLVLFTDVLMEIIW